MAVACVSGSSLDESPDINDPCVGEYKRNLGAELQLEHVMASFKNTGLYLRIAVNASADRVEPLIKIQNGLFEVLKVCDSTSILLQSLKNGANNILEKLRIAYLYILDGFPDFAKTDIEAIAKDIKTMKEKGKSTSNAVRSAKDKINAAEETTKTDWQTRERDSKSKQKKHQTTKSETEIALRHKLILRMLELANGKLNSAMESVSTTERVIERWYSECKHFIEPTMAKNFKAADSLPKDKQKDFWDPLKFKKEAFSYLCRWRALQDYCEDTRRQIRQTRGIVDAYYTENLYPQDAIKFAWELTKELQSADKTISGLLREYDGRNGEAFAETHAPQTSQETRYNVPLASDSVSSETSTEQSDDDESVKTPSKLKNTTRSDLPDASRFQGKNIAQRSTVRPSGGAHSKQPQTNTSKSTTSSTTRKKNPSALATRSKKQTDKNATSSASSKQKNKNSKTTTKKESPKKQDVSQPHKKVSRRDATSKTCTVS